MANVQTAPFGIGPNAFWGFTSAIIAALGVRALAVLGYSFDDALRPPVQWVDLDANATVSAGSTKDSYVWLPPYPITIVRVEGAALTAGGATGTVDLHVKPSGGSYATVLSAAIDVKTPLATYTNGIYTAGTVVDTDDRHKAATTAEIKAIFSSGSGDTLTGGRCRVYFVRTVAS